MPDPDYHLNVEIEEAARSKLAEPKRGLSKAALIVLFALICLLLLAMPFWLQRPSTPDNVDTGADENLLPPVSQVKLVASAGGPRTATGISASTISIRE